MTPQEFKAWFDGYTEAIGDVPHKKQWARVKERVAAIDGKPVTERVFVDRYWPSVGPWYPPYWTYRSQQASGLVPNALLCASNNTQQYNSLSAMNALGRAEAAA